MPVVFSQFLSSPEDYYERFPIANALRLLRWTGFVASMILPSLYVAVTTFHHEMLPTELILSIAAAREGVPFPVIVEALLMELLFELLREAGLRLPKVVGPAVTIVGALILGQAAIQARLVSPALLIMVAITAWMGRLVILPYLWAFLHLSAFILRQFGEALATAVLPDTPLVLLMGFAPRPPPGGSAVFAPDPSNGPDGRLGTGRLRALTPGVGGGQGKPGPGFPASGSNGFPRPRT